MRNVGTSRVKPSVYFSPIAHPTSNKSGDEQCYPGQRVSHLFLFDHDIASSDDLLELVSVRREDRQVAADVSSVR